MILITYKRALFFSALICIVLSVLAFALFACVYGYNLFSDSINANIAYFGLAMIIASFIFLFIAAASFISSVIYKLAMLNLYNDGDLNDPLDWRYVTYVIAKRWLSNDDIFGRKL